jgi:hypothetical protein
MGAVLSANSAPIEKLDLPAAAPPAAAAALPTPAASLPVNDLRRSLKRKYEPLELVSTTAPADILPRPVLSNAKKRKLRADRHRLELMSTSSRCIAPSGMTVEVGRFDIRTRLQAGSSGHLHDIWQCGLSLKFGKHFRIRGLLSNQFKRNRQQPIVSNKFAIILINLIITISLYLDSGGHNSEARSKLPKLYNCLTIHYNSKGWVWPKPVSL